MPQDLNQHWNNCYTPGRDFSIETSQGISKFLQHTDPIAPKTALDIGCGTGQLTRELWHRGYNTVGIDVSESAIRIAQSLTTVSDGTLSYKHLDIEQDDTTSLPWQPYGLITCKLVYAFMHDKSAFLQTVARLLDSKGSFVVITPLLETTPPEKRGPAVSQEDIHVLQAQFQQTDWYEERGLGYFVGTKQKQNS